MCAAPLGRRGTDRQTKVKVKVGRAALLSPLFAARLLYRRRFTAALESQTHTRCPVLQMHRGHRRYVKGHIGFF